MTLESKAELLVTTGVYFIPLEPLYRVSITFMYFVSALESSWPDRHLLTGFGRGLGGIDAQPLDKGSLQKKAARPWV